MTDQKTDQTAIDQKVDDATKKPVPDVKSDELSETDVAKVTGGSWGEAQTGTMSTRTGKTNPITLIE